MTRRDEGAADGSGPGRLRASRRRRDLCRRRAGEVGRRRPRGPSADPHERRSRVAGSSTWTGVSSPPHGCARPKRRLEVLGLASVRVGSVHDSELENTEDVREGVVRRIREVRAETVVACDPTTVFFENRYYNHSDHRVSGFVATGCLLPRERQPALLPRAAERTGFRCRTCSTSGSDGRTNRTMRRTSPASSRRKVDALAKHASQLEEGIRFFEDFLGQGRGGGGGEDRRRARRGVPRPRPQLGLAQPLTTSAPRMPDVAPNLQVNVSNPEAGKTTSTSSCARTPQLRSIP